nr:MAG TPA: nucelotide kinase [Caudoviricetes sp.]
MKLKNCLWRYKMNLQENVKEAVNKPSHYVGEKGLEVKEVLENFVKNKKGMEAHRWCSAVEYLLRYAEKNGVEDLKKARKNIEWLIES